MSICIYTITHIHIYNILVTGVDNRSHQTRVNGYQFVLAVARVAPALFAPTPCASVTVCDHPTPCASVTVCDDTCVYNTLASSCKALARRT